MTRFFLPVLLWTLAISPIFAQKKLAPGIEPYAVNWSYSVKQMLEAAGYTVPGPHAEFELTPASMTRSSSLELDSTVSFYGYDVANDSLPLLRNTYTYPSPDKQVIVESFYDQDHWEPMARTTLIADDLGRMIETHAENYDAESGLYMPDSKILLYPRGSSQELVDSFFIYGWSVEFQEWVRMFATWNAFDNQNRIKESVNSIELFDVPLVFIDRYKYNTDGDMFRIESYTMVEDEEILAGRQDLWYDDHLLVSAHTLVSHGPEGLITESKIEYTYTHFREEENVTYYVYDLEKNDWMFTKVNAFAYDEHERLIAEEVVELTEGIWTRTLKTTSYVSDDESFPAMEANLIYDDNAETWVLEDKKFYYYTDLTATDDPDDIVADALFLYPNPTAGVVQIQLPGKVSVHVYTLSGQFVQKYSMAPGERILDLSFLPAGIYQVMALSDEDYFSGKLVIQ